MNDDPEDLFEEVLEFPNSHAASVLAELVGLENIHEQILKEVGIRLQPSSLEEWSRTKHGRRVALVDSMRERGCMFIFAGDVGTGKTALAQSIGDLIAKRTGIPITLFRLTLRVRGSGAVGEMTKLLSLAFTHVRDRARKLGGGGAMPRGCVILLVDEADALAQSRDLNHMHHEDRAGVNALIRGVDTLSSEELPALVIMCTNRPSSLDPAVRRRAAEVFEFRRPDESQRIEVLSRALRDVGFTDTQLRKLAQATGPRGEEPGFSYSDLRQRFLVELLLDAYPDRKVEFERALEIANVMRSTPTFGSGGETS